MKFTYSWLKEYCPINLKPDELASLLTGHGLKVESHQSLGNDTLFELEITANRPDLLGVIGIAREVAALTGQKLKLPQVKEKPIKSKSTSGKGLVKVDSPEFCPGYLGRVIKGVRIGNSPKWLRERLEAVGLNPINNVVDITNYVLLECGQPLHAFDFNRLEGKRIIVRNARKGEKILAIDAKEYQLTPGMLVIADEKNPVALAGIMGGKATEVIESTTDILLESASFEPKNIRRTSQALKLASDSSYRFERNVPRVNMEWGSKRATALIREIAGGKVTVEKLVATREPTEKKVTLNIDRVWRLIGVPIDKETIKRILKALGFVPTKEWRGNIDFKVPLFRTDINEAVDVIEEIARVYGYDEVPMAAPITVPDVLEKLPGDELLNQIRDTLVGLGCFEALTNSFVDEKYLSDFPFWCDNPLEKAITFANTPMKLRNNLASALLAALRLNEGYQRESHIKFFEVAKVYYKACPSRQQQGLPETARDKASSPYEKFCLGLLDNRGFLSLKGTLEALLGRIKLTQEIQYEPVELTWFKSGQCLKIKLGDQVLGYLGEINPPLIDKYQTTNQVALAELDWAVMVKNAQLAVTYREFPRLPAIQRDLALVMDEKVKWAQVAEIIQKTGGAYLEKVNFFDLYRGSQVAKGKKSIACALVFRAPDRTLTNEEVDTTINKIVASLGSNLAATLRS